MLMEILEGQTKSIMVFLILANKTHILNDSKYIANCAAGDERGRHLTFQVNLTFAPSLPSNPQPITFPPQKGWKVNDCWDEVGH